MTRKSHMALPSFGPTFGKLAAATLAAAAFAAPAQAGIVGFDADYSMAFAHGDTWTEAGYKLTFDAYKNGADGSNGVGAIIDSTDPWPCIGGACPVNGDGTYYGAFNDSVVWLESATQNARFRFNSLDASFIGAFPSLGAYPIISGILSVQALTADGQTLIRDLYLDGPGANGFEFGTYFFDAAFASADLLQVGMFGYVCDVTGSCNAFGTNQGQFAIDNLNLTEVPEPASIALFGMGAMGLLAAARRRRQA